MSIPPITYGGLDDLQSSIGGNSYLVMTQEVPWNLVRPRIERSSLPKKVVKVSSVKRDYLDGLLKKVPAVQMVVGIGGGVCIDAAKYVAWRKGIPIITVPTILSVDAYLLGQSVVRERGSAYPVGHASIAKVIIDMRVIQAAPKRMNTAGAADVYCCKTAIEDWRLAYKNTGEPYDERMVRKTKEVIGELVRNSEDIKNVTDNGIKALVKLHADANRLCFEAGNGRPEEGAEHTFAYAVDRAAGRGFLHGEIVGTGIYVVSHFQSDDEEETGRIMDGLGIKFRPPDYGLTKTEFVSAVMGMKSYSQLAKLPFSVLDVAEIGRTDAEGLWTKLSS